MLLDLSCLSYPLPPDVRRLYEAGDFDRMELVIRRRLDDPCVPEALKARLRVQLEMAYEIPRAYPYTRAQMLDILQKNVSGFAEEELETLRDDGTLDWRYVNGEVRFKNNALSALLKTRKEYAMRATDPAVMSGTKASAEQLSTMSAKMKANGGVRARFELHEELTVRSDRLTEGETLRIHLPMPIVGAQVKRAELLSASHPVAFLAPEDEPQRTIYFELPYEPGMTVSAEIAYEIDAPYAQPHAREVYAEQPVFDTEELPPHVVFTPYLRALAKEIVGDETNALLKARKIYDFITTQAVYRFMPPYLTVPNIPEYFLSGLRGDCGVQAITFVTLCRLCGVPAQWQSGLYTKPNSAGHHDWARFYVAPFGWLFADCSFGGSAYRAGDLDRWNFYFGNLEPWRMPTCSAFQQEFNPPRRFLRHDPYDNQSGEVESLTRRLYADEYEDDCRVVRYEEME